MANRIRTATGRRESALPTNRYYQIQFISNYLLGGNCLPIQENTFLLKDRIAAYGISKKDALIESIVFNANATIY